MNDQYLNQALQQVQQWRSEDKCIVFTNGCFDLLHPGHIDYLAKARALGDTLIIGLNDDNSVHRLKGSSRPINPLAHRIIMLAALKSVSLVVPFSEDTPLKLISALIPDILVKGGDYKASDIVGAKEVTANGGKVVVMPFIDGHSTSSLIQKIQKNKPC